jgi:Malonate decarboxylase, alpha subunit, transporter
MTNWERQRHERQARLDEANRYANGKVVPPESAKALLEAVIRPGDRVCLEGDNQNLHCIACHPGMLLTGAATRGRRDFDSGPQRWCLVATSFMTPQPFRDALMFEPSAWLTRQRRDLHTRHQKILGTLQKG